MKPLEFSCIASGSVKWYNYFDYFYYTNSITQQFQANRNTYISVLKHLCRNIHSKSTYNSSKLETTKMANNSTMHK